MKEYNLKIQESQDEMKKKEMKRQNIIWMEQLRIANDKILEENK